MTTTHQIIAGDARQERPPAKIDLVVTSPPYPMIAMWDTAFSTMNPRIESALANNGHAAFELMHDELDAAWQILFEEMSPGGICCINIGDAVRTVDGVFRLYPNHSRISLAMMKLGFDQLPGILWRKPTNSPTKFMGSGMLPAGAYVTLEHEHILVFRKPGRRSFSPDEKNRRRESAIFWEERNQWFSDLWNIAPASQDLGDTSSPDKGGRKRSAAFPFELPYRLIMMYSIYGDTVYDPFGGTFTTSRAAIAAGRSSIAVEHNRSLVERFWPPENSELVRLARRPGARLSAHAKFIQERVEQGKAVGYQSGEPHTVPVVTAQEKKIVLWVPAELRRLESGGVEASHVRAQ